MFRPLIIASCLLIASSATHAAVSPTFDEALQMLADFTPYLYNNYQTIDEHNSNNEPMATFRGENTMGNNEQGVRHNADLSMICAFLCKYAKGKVMLPEGISWDSLATMAMHTLTYSYSTHKANRLFPCKGGQYWGSVSERDHAWESSLWAMSVAYSAFFQWDKLNTQQRDCIYKMLKAECNYELERSIPTNMEGDTKAEENGWECDVLAVTLGLFPNDKLAPRWFDRLREFAINSYSHESDKDFNYIIDHDYDTKTVADLYRGANLYADYTLQNHNYFHTSYQNVVAQELGEAALALQLFQQELHGTTKWYTNALMYNIRMVNEQVLYNLALRDGELAMPNGNDWSLFLYDQITSYSTASCFLRDTDALMLEQQALQQIKARQKTTTDGSWLLRPDVGARRMGVEAHRVMMTWLMHHIRPTTDLQPTTWDDFLARYSKAKHYKLQDVVTASSADRFACFSWSKGLKSYTGYFAPTSETQNNIVVPFRANNTGNFIGWYEVEGRRTDAADKWHKAETFTGNMYMIQGRLDTNGGALANNYCMLVTWDNVIIYFDIVRALEDATITKERGGLLAISTDPFTRTTRSLVYNNYTHTDTGGDMLFRFQTDWVSIDETVSVLARHHSRPNIMAFGDKGNNNSILTSRLYASYSDERREVKQGDVVDARCFAYYSNTGNEATQNLNSELKPIKSMSKGWRGWSITDTNGFTYAIIYALDHTAKTDEKSITKECSDVVKKTKSCLAVIVGRPESTDAGEEYIYEFHPMYFAGDEK